MRTSIPPAEPAEEHVTDDWRHRAACRDEDPELFFPAGDESSPANQPQVKEAKRVCATCRVRTACLADAIETGQDFGIFGGMTPDERRAMRRRTRRRAA